MPLEINQEFRHFYRCRRSFNTFVSDVATAAMDCLIKRIHCQDTKSNRLAVFNRHLHERFGDSVVDMLVVSCFTTDNASERDGSKNFFSLE